MKRSEMVKLMVDTYKDYIKPMKDLGYPMPNLVACDMIILLNKIEEAGMLPPVTYYQGYEVPRWDDKDGE